jgi:hypothetical protein
MQPNAEVDKPCHVLPPSISQSQWVLADVLISTESRKMMDITTYLKKQLSNLNGILRYIAMI